MLNSTKSVFTLISLGSMVALNAASIDDTKSKLEQWVEVRQNISKEKSEWIAEKELLIQSETLLKNELEALESEINSNEADNTVADEKRNELLLERAGHYQVAEVLAKDIVAFEQSVLALVKRFPEPLKDALKPLIVRIPLNPEETKLTAGQRMQTVMGILRRAEKFDKTANFVGETREIDSGKKVQVRTLYWGLSFAYYVDVMGQKAGIGVPGDDGWVWTPKNEIAAEVKNFIDIYEGNTDAITFVSLPVSVK